MCCSEPGHRAGRVCEIPMLFIGIAIHAPRGPGLPRRRDWVVRYETSIFATRIVAMHADLSVAMATLLHRDLSRETKRQLRRDRVRPTESGEVRQMHLYRSRSVYRGLGRGRGSLQFCGLARLGGSHALEDAFADEEDELDLMRILVPNTADESDPQKE
jgi:hypothetical protein